MMTFYRHKATGLASDEGETAVEYAIVIAFVALVIILAVTAIGGRTGALLAGAATAF